ETSKIIGACRKNGLILLPCGRYNNVIRLIPPLIVKKEEIDMALNILIKALAL
ncbi:4-aminobutyrate--2-oxoglutarate transaminase, partial [Thermococci archaeon]